MCQKWKFTVLAPVMMLVLAGVAPAFGQGSCAENCGDVDHSGDITVTDFTYLTAYLLEGGPPPPCLDEAEWDDRQLVTVNDLVILVDWLFSGDFPPPCPPSGAPIVPLLDSSSYLQLRLCDRIIAPGQTSETIPLYTFLTDHVYAVTFPLKFRVGTAIPTVSLAEWKPAADTFDLGPFFDSDDSGRVRLAGVNIVSLPPANELLPFADIRLDFAPADTAREYTVEWTSYPPVQDSQEVVLPMINSGSWSYPDVTQPALITGYCVNRADIDDDGRVTVSDLTSYAFCLFGQCWPPCNDWRIGDIDGSGSWNVADITYLVAYLFQGGPEPPPC